MRYIFCGFLLGLILWLPSAFGQTRPRPTQPVAEGDKKEAKDNYSIGLYAEAIPEYQVLLKKDPTNLEYNFRMGVCYLETYIDKTLAIPYLETAEKDPKRDPETLYHLGRAYMHAHQFDDAIRKFEDYIKAMVGKEPEIQKARLGIQHCQVAKKMVRHPVQVKYENLGKYINTAGRESTPYITPDESTLIYTSRPRKSITDPLDYNDAYPGDVFIASAKSDGEWRRGRSIGATINSDLTEEAAGISADGNNIFIFIDNYNGYGDLWYSSRRGRSYKPAEAMDKGAINTAAFESSATMTIDEEFVIFSSDYDGGYGGLDLYMCRKLPTGYWGQPQNLGPMINTDADEQYPALSFDQHTLYFSSNGRKSMGGFDIFQTEWQHGGKEFPEPRNMGYPVNTTADETTISFDETGRFAYMSLGRKDGFGDLDIYRLTIESVDPRYTVIQGFITNPDSSSIAAEGVINVYDPQSALLYGTYKIKESNGKFLMILPPGTWMAEIEVDGFEKFREELVIRDRAHYVPMLEKNIVVGGTSTEKKQ